MVQCRNRDRARIAGRDAASQVLTPAGSTVSQPPNRGDDGISVEDGLGPALNDSLLNHLHGVFGQQLQDADVLPRPGLRAITLLPGRTQLIEAGRQLPLVEHEGMIQGRGPAAEDRQVMPGRHDPFPSRVATPMAGNPSSVGHDLDSIHIRFDRHRLERPAAGNAVTVRVEPHGLVLVHLGRLGDEGIEGTRRQRQGSLSILLKQLSNRLCSAGHHMIAFGQRTGPQVNIQFGQVLHPGNRGRPVPLQIVHTVLHVRLLVAPRRHAEPRIEAVVAGQRRVALLNLPLAALQDGGGHALGIIPPDLPGHTLEESQAFDHAGQDRLRLLTRQRHRKTKARMTPGQQQDRDQLASLRKVHVDVSEVRLQPSARRMRQWEERLPLGPLHPAHVSPHLVIAACIAMFIPQTPVPLRCRMLLLGGSTLILRQNLLDQSLVGTQPRCRPILLQRIRTRLALLERLADLPPRMLEPPGDLPNAHPITMRNSDLAVLFHRQHLSFFSVKPGFFKSPQPTETAAVGPFSMPISTPRGGSLLRADFQITQIGIAGWALAHADHGL